MQPKFVKGAKSELVIFYSEYNAEPDAQNGVDDAMRRVARATFVVNAPKVDGFDISDGHLFTGIDSKTRDESYFNVFLHELTH